MGRPFRVSTFTYKPYTIVNPVMKGKPYKIARGGNFVVNNATKGAPEDSLALLDGTEARPFHLYCLKYNCTVELLDYEFEKWGDIWDEKNGTGLLGAVLRREADAGVAALCLWYHEYHYLDLAAPLTRTGVTCVAPKPRRLSAFFMPAQPFSKALWICVFIGFVSSSLMICVARGKDRHDRLGHAFMTVMGIYLAQGAMGKVGGGARVGIIALFLVCGLILGLIYGAGFSSIMTVPRFEPPIDSVHDLRVSQLLWGSTGTGFIFSMLGDDRDDIVALLSTFRVLTEEELHKVSYDRHYALGVERLPAGHFAVGDYLTANAVPGLRLMRDDIYWDHVVAMMPKSNVHTPNLNKLTQEIVQAGLVHVWEMQVSNAHQDFKVQQGILLSLQSKTSQGEPEILTLEHLIGVFTIWGLGVVISLICFVFEIIRSKSMLKKMF
ncbi:glutamate [NMDA] receptor subunit 1-like [Ctenocephalides felis]|uniref:glutamate [NMDA] receptor subunit 1-like n=1 Tax=Ctenocephalides felis TaxID=7515 RepID=UPI000E6E4497|nr:glutamate [NMDA] receptor subunit 1-like [Ctenocephalides felis]